MRPKAAETVGRMYLRSRWSGPRIALWEMGRGLSFCIRLYYTSQSMAELFDLDQLDGNDPFEIDRQAAHLFKPAGLGIDDIWDAGNPTRSAAEHLADRYLEDR